jgi:hypothetical protein
MSELTARYVFALLCGVGMIAIGMGTVLEIARFRRNARSAAASTSAASDDNPLVPGGNIISLRQFRFRLLSAVIWMIVLATLCYATTALWPDRTSPQALEQVRRFGTVVIAALSLLMIAVVLFIYDVVQLSRERRAQTARFHKGLADMARNEAAQLQQQRAAQQHVADNSSASTPSDAGAADDENTGPALHIETSLTGEARRDKPSR